MRSDIDAHAEKHDLSPPQKPTSVSKSARDMRTALKQAIAAAAAAERAGQAHGAVGKALKGAVDDLRAETIRGRTRGDRIARGLSDGVDRLVLALFEVAARDAQSDIALCAVGGYGRRQLAPYSDVDLLFLYSPDFEARLGEMLNALLYPLWDSGLKLGYAAHTPKSAVAFAREDMTGRTAYLDARFVCGARDIFQTFVGEYERLRQRSKTQFVAAKLQEQDDRQARFFETRYLVEPDVKEGKGGLRDLQTIGWIYKYVYGGDIGSTAAIDKVLDEKERRALAKTEKFLWSVRAHLHDLRGRADEKLTFDIQPEVAARLGYADRADMSAAERLMKHYFVNTVEVGRLTRILCARLEEERAKRQPRLPKALPRALQQDEAPGKPNLRIRGGRLDFASASTARRRPRDLFRLFRAYGKKPKIDFHPDALAIVSEETAQITSDVRKDPVIAALFAGILTGSRDPMRVLRVMTETGLLGKYVPAFGSIVGRIDYGLYRRFTLDEHVLRCIAMLRRIEAGLEKDAHPITTRIVQRSEKPFLIYLAVLLHESVWTVKNRSAVLCEKLVVRICRRLGLPRDEASLVGWAAAHYLTMIRVAERRDLAESRAIAGFAKGVATRERLDLMLALSVCHLRVVGHRSWDDVTRRQLKELHEAAGAWIDGGDAALDERLSRRMADARKETLKRLADWSDDERNAMMNQLTNAMLGSVGPHAIVRFAHLARAAEADEARSAVTVTAGEGDLEAIVYTDDRSGLLADLAGAVAGAGFSVRSVQALTTRDGKALDIFVIQSPEGTPLKGGEEARRLHGALLSAAEAPPLAKPSLRRRLGDRRAIFNVAPVIRIELTASDEATVIEAEGLDRPGLLYDLASALSELGVVIASAHIATYGERAVDAFYVQTAERRKVTDANMLTHIENRLMDALCAGSDA